MPPSPLRRLLQAVFTTISLATLAPATTSPADVRKSFVEHYATLLHAKYSDAHAGTIDLKSAIEAFAKAPSAATHAAAKAAWIAARPAYLETEVARFYGGPIDDPESGPEGMINAWPLDEAYLDAVEGDPTAGLINQVDAPITAATLREMNERDGEKNISTGYHAIEFLLWGQDFYDDTPGQRPLTDFTTEKNAARRLEALKILAHLLTEDLKSMVDAWQPGSDNFRRKLLAMPTEEAIGKIVTGMGALQAGELAGERLSVAYDTKEQEDEHSCFSDTTHLDTVHNARGIVNTFTGSYQRRDGSKIEGTGYRDVIRASAPEFAAQLENEMAATLAAVQAIPVPFDQAILGGDAAPGRVAIKTAIDALQACSKTLSKATAAAGLRPAPPIGAPAMQDFNATPLGLLLVLAALGSARLAAQVTTTDTTRQAFGQPVGDLDSDATRRFFVGNSFFNHNWVIAPSSTAGRDGLGPLFNMRSCSSCHLRDGRGELPPEGEPLRSALVRLGIPGLDEHHGIPPDPVYGGQFQGLAIPKAEAEGDAIVHFETVVETFADGTEIQLRKPVISLTNLRYGPLHPDLLTSLRVAPAIHGGGLLEAIPEADILAQADPDDANGDGISGRANRVWDARSGQKRLGRFGWKANQPDLLQQVAAAFRDDIGITSELFPEESTTAKQAAKLAGLPNGGTPEIDAHKLDAVTFYCQTLAVPVPRNQDDPQVVRGAALFRQANCTACHTPTWTTAADAAIPPLAGQKIHPFTDLLLHDMGPDLADGRPDFEATGSEWRTPPLWGLGLNQAVNGRVNFLHDGRARTALEAIMWHGGEATASREHVRQMSAEDRAALVAFLNSL